MIELEYSIEHIGGGVSVCTSPAHTFGTDSFLLASFAAPRAGDAVCDLGSGCGIIPLLWFRVEASPARAVAVDIQLRAIEQLAASVKLSGLDGKLQPVLADLRELKGSIDFASFDLVTCNPPYKAADTGIISRSESDKIARHETLCTLDDCCAAAAKALHFGGRFCLCQLPERLVDVLESMRKNKIEPKRIRFVQKDKDSPPWLVLVEGKRGSKPFLQAEPALLLYEDGKLSKEMREIYGRYKEEPDNI